VHPQLCCQRQRWANAAANRGLYPVGGRTAAGHRGGVEAWSFADGVLQFIELLCDIVSRLRQLAALGDVAEHCGGDSVDPRGPQYFRTQGSDTGEQRVHPRLKRLIAAWCDVR
jgi:hypothetical protein